jgi:hypothetical protein
MTDTPNLALPLLAAAQSQKHVTHNEALALLDALVQLTLATRDANAPPAAPAPGTRLLVGDAPTGAFAGRAGEIALFDAGAWRFIAPRAGFRAWIEAEEALFAFDGAAWREIGTDAPLDNLPRLGIGTAADAQNPFAARVPNALFASVPAGEGGDGDIRIKLVKETQADTASLLYQTAWSGRAELGLAGDDRFRLKVSADGSAWHEAIRAEPGTGQVSFPSGLRLEGPAAAPFVRALRSRAGGPRPVLEMNFADGLFLFHAVAPGAPAGGALITGDLLPFVQALGGAFTRASEKRVRDSHGCMVVIPAGEPALEADGNGRPLGLLVEEARQNRVASSEAPNIVSNASLSANAAMAPDGTMTAEKLVENTANAGHFITFADAVGTPADNAVVSASVFLRAAERTLARLAYVKKNGGFLNVTVDMTTGAVGTVDQSTGGGAATAKAERWIAPDGGLWWRVCLENINVLTGATPPTLRVYPVTGTLASSIITYTGDGTSGLFAWGGQIELADTVSSYIRTTGSTVTRAADQLWLPTTGIVPASEGVLVAQARLPNTPSSGVNRTFVSLDDGSFSNRLQIRRTANSPNAHVVALSGGTSLFSADIASAFADDEAIVALKFRAGDHAWSADGGAVAVNGAASVPPFTRLQVGASVAGNTPCGGHIGWISLRHRAGLNADLPLLSAAA